MRIVIKAHQLPGRQCGPYRNVHIALQVGSRPEGLVAADAADAEWQADVRVTAQDDARDFTGPAVHGRRGDRFLYLTWGEVDGQNFAMFRRAKVMLADVPAVGDEVVADVDLTDESGMPRCARLHEPQIHWSVTSPV